jgi:CRP-like cAMP-binding protein
MSFPPSTLDAHTQAFPALTSAQIDRIRPLAHSRQVRPGEILFEPNDTAVPFFVLLSGSMEIVQPTLEGERPIATHGPGGFTGEITMISGQQSLVRGRVTFRKSTRAPDGKRGKTTIDLAFDSLPKDIDLLQKVVVELCEWLQHESSEKNKYRSLLRELLDAQRNRKSEMVRLIKHHQIPRWRILQPLYALGPLQRVDAGKVCCVMWVSSW